MQALFCKNEGKTRFTYPQITRKHLVILTKRIIKNRRNKADKAGIIQW